jgi:integrase
MASKPSRLSKNQHGTYCLRWIVPARYRDSNGKPRELRFSLRTNDTVRARILALEFNLALERLHAMTQHVDPRKLIAPWTLETGDLKIEVKDAEDQKLFNQFLIDNPDIRQRLLESIRSGTDPVAARVELMASIKDALGAAQGVSVPTKLPTAKQEFIASRSTLSDNSEDTIAEKKRTLSLLEDYLTSPGKDSSELFVHEITQPNILKFVTAHASRPGKAARKKKDKEEKAAVLPVVDTAEKTDEEKKPIGLHAGTVTKVISHIREFLAYAKVQHWIKDNPLGADFDIAIAGLKAKANKSKTSGGYKIFSENDISEIFAPARYLARNKSADEFWVPLLALYSGARLGEVTDLSLNDIHIDPDSGLLCMNIGTKNENSIRTVPIHETLITLGFRDLIEHVKKLGADRLYPHRPLNKTREKKPGKLMSRNFAEFLDVVGISDTQHVFHSFRHTAITRMHAEGVPVSDAELIVGHAAQDVEVRLNAARRTSGKFKSTHLGTYVHTGDYENENIPLMARLKEHMTETLAFPIDIARLTKAAKIVQEHIILDKTGEKPVFKSGWHTNKVKYSELKIKELG